TAPRGASGPAERLSVLAAPVPGTEEVVVAVANRTPGEANNGRLLGYMWWSAALMVAFSLVVAVFLARGRWWVADQVLARHEAFLRDTAHELRGPVSSLRAVAEAGLAGAEPPERALERVAAIVRGTDELVDDLLTLSRMQTGQEPLQAAPVRLDELVTSLVRARADEPAVALAVQPSTVVANAELVRRAVGNLLDNAVRHGRAGDPTAAVTVTVAGGRVEVADAGPGLEPQLLPDLVERSGNGHRTTGGRLGLTLARRVAHVHGGELRAANRPGGGAVFTLELPEHGR
ncbi:MAG TPA: ATP-binding protein, partial [Acidimicrobiales bacterium]